MKLKGVKEFRFIARMGTCPQDKSGKNAVKIKPLAAIPASSQAKGTKSTLFLMHEIPYCVRNTVDLVPLACEDAIPAKIVIFQ